MVVRATALQSCRAHQSAATTALDNSILVSVYVENVSVVSRSVNICVVCVKHVSVVSYAGLQYLVGKLY